MKKTLNKLKEEIEEWEGKSLAELKGGELKGLEWQTPEGIKLQPLYTATDLENLEWTDSLPGFFPFVRGPRVTMYAGSPWTIRQYAGFSTAEESNRFYQENLKAGQKGLSVAFDLATYPPNL